LKAISHSGGCKIIVGNQHRGETLKKLIISADDYGYSSNISRGIRDAYTKGVLTATSAIMNIATPVEDVYAALEETPGLAIGVHLNIYNGKPVSDPSKVKTLVDDQGHFLGKKGLLENSGGLDLEDVETELRAQVDLLLSTGCKLDHINMHGIDSIWLSPKIWELNLQLCVDYDCPVRPPFNYGQYVVEGNTYFEDLGINPEDVYAKYDLQVDIMNQYPVFHADDVDTHIIIDQSAEKYAEKIKNYPDGLFESVCHAGYSDAELAKYSSVTDERDRTVDILIDPIVRQAIEANDIHLTTLTKEYENYKKEMSAKE
jgi:hypothetical protein